MLSAEPLNFFRYNSTNVARIRVTVPVYSSRKSYVQTKPITHSAENENGNETSDELVFFQHSIPAYVQLTNVRS